MGHERSRVLKNNRFERDASGAATRGRTTALENVRSRYKMKDEGTAYWDTSGAVGDYPRFEAHERSRV